MELVYLWVEDYKNIHRQGFNFSPKFNCHYDPDTNVLTIDENNDYVENFFGDNINVTAIVGKNGSGKSSICDQVLFSIFNNQNTILVIEVEDEFYILQKDYNSQKIIINSKVKVKKISETNLIDIVYLETEKDCPPVREDFIETIEQPSLYDEITDLLYIDSYSSEYRENNKILLSSDKFGIYIAELYLLGYDLENSFFDFSIKSLQLSQNNKYFYDLIYETSQTGLMDKYKSIYHYLQRSIYDMYLYHLFFNMNLHNEFFDKCVEKQNSEQDIFVINYKKAYQILNAYSVKSFVYHHEFEKFNNYLLKNDGYINLEELRMVKKHLFPFFIFNVYDKKSRGYNDLSYGEKMILTQLINIFYKVVTSDKKSILIVLDEPDISLHPSWQKKYLSQIYYFLSKIDKKIQILLSTHSPFLLSDIPKQKEIITIEQQSEYYKNVKQQVIDRIQSKKFAIIE